MRLLGLLLAGALAVAACGSSRDDDSSSGSTTTEASTTAPGRFGTLASPCGEGNAKGATQRGVTDSSITIMYGDDAGFAASPGLNHEQSDAMRAMIEWCNDQGGILGREVVGIYGDAKITEVNNVMTQACEQAFMLVGEGWALDASQEQIRLGCDLAAVPAWSVSPAFAHGPLMVQPAPNPVDFTAVQSAAAIAEAFPDKIEKSAVMFANYSATIDTKDKVLASYPEFGFRFLDCPQQYNIAGEADWKPFVQKLKDCGAEVVYWTGSPYPNFQNFLEAADQLDYEPIYMTDANFYDQQFAAWNTKGLADNVYVRLGSHLLEDADEVPAVEQYLDILEANDGDVSLLGAQAASAFLLWATGVKECGSNLTSTCVLDQLGEVEDWTGGGLHTATDPAANMPSECGVTVKLDGTKWVRFAPKAAATFDCDDSYVVEVTGRVVDQAKLDANRVSTLFKP